ncbi:hypothetical protein J3R30DRAFT_3461217, partial [Lentinula aciculospora]
MKDRWIIITLQTPSDWTLGEKELVVKANLAMERIIVEEGTETVTPEVLTAMKIANKGAFLLLRSVDELCHMGSTVSLRPNYAEIVVESLPVETPIDSPVEQRRIEAMSGLRPGTIRSIRWIKQIEKRKDGQRHAFADNAHAIFSMDTRDDANELLTGR